MRERERITPRVLSHVYRINKRDDLLHRRELTRQICDADQIEEDARKARFGYKSPRMVRQISEIQFSCQTRWLNYKLENGRNLGGWANLQEVSSPVPYNAGVLVLPILLTGEHVVKCGEGSVMNAEG